MKNLFNSTINAVKANRSHILSGGVFIAAMSVVTTAIGLATLTLVASTVSCLMR